MQELLRSNDLVWLSWVQALLTDSGIESIVLDGHAGVLEGSAQAIPRRLMVADEDMAPAGALVREAEQAAGLAGWDSAIAGGEGSDVS